MHMSAYFAYNTSVLIHKTKQVLTNLGTSSVTCTSANQQHDLVVSLMLQVIYGHLYHCLCICRLAAGVRSLSRGQQCRKTGACKPCAASNKVTDAGWEGIAGSVGVGILWAALACESSQRITAVQLPSSCIAGNHYLSDSADYGFVLSPNQTPYRDMYFLEKLLGLGVDDGVQVNTVFTRLCWLMGVWPAVYASLLLPTAKSGNKVFVFCQCFLSQRCPYALPAQYRFLCVAHMLQPS